MSKLIASVIVALAFGVGSAFAVEPPLQQLQSETEEKAAVCEQLKSDGATPEQFAQQGCCSWHGGICGCEFGTIVCCDGQYSPTCKCY